MQPIKRIIFTKEGYEKLLAEKKQLQEDRVGAVVDLKKAREMGDLSENGYYKASRWKLSGIDRRLSEIERLLRRAHIVEKSVSETIEVGATVVIFDGRTEKTYIIVGGFESNPSEGKISHISPLGKSLLGKRKGDTITFQTPGGEKVYKVLAIS